MPVSRANDGDADDKTGKTAGSASVPNVNDHDADDRMSVSSPVQRATSSAAAALTALQEVG
jgi:hypothetical protein